MGSEIYVIFQKRALLLELVRRSFKERFHGKVLGTFWFFLQPLVTIGVYLYVFGYAIGSKSGVAGIYSNPVIILSGLIPWYTLIDCMSKSCYTFKSNSSLIKQVIFPIQILPLVPVVLAMIQQMVLFLFLFIFLLFKGYEFGSEILYLPLLLFLQFIFLVGIAYFFSTFTVFLGDLPEIVQVFGSLGVYVTPIFFDPETVHRYLGMVISINPTTIYINTFQSIFVAELPEAKFLIMFTSMSFVVFMIGWRFYTKVKPVLGNFI